jgi:hypothetical protein
MNLSDRRIILLNDVRGDFPFGHNIVAKAGIYNPYINPHGAISVIAENGEKLGIKPGEFEWLDEKEHQ